MDIPEDLGKRIVEAARLAVALHLQQSLCSTGFIPGGTVSLFGGAIIPIGGADLHGGATDGHRGGEPYLATAADCEAQ